MKLSQIIEIIKKNEYPTSTPKGERKAVDVDTLISEIKSLHTEQISKQKQLNKELRIVNMFGFQEIQDKLFRVIEKDIVLFFDYRSGTRRSWATNIIDSTLQDKTELMIYSAFKKQLKKLELEVEKNITLVCDNCSNDDKATMEIYGSKLHPDRKYKCNKCDRVFEVKE